LPTSDLCGECVRANAAINTSAIDGEGSDARTGLYGHAPRACDGRATNTDLLRMEAVFGPSDEGL